MQEGKNARRFKKLYAEKEDILVPDIFWDYTSGKVLTMEWVDGVKLSQHKGIESQGLKVLDLVNTGIQCSLRQLLEYGYFHADPHPGNLLATPEGKLVFLDFGMMSETPEEARFAIIGHVVHLVNRDYEAMAQDYYALKFLSRDVDVTLIVPALQNFFDDALNYTVSELNFKTLVDGLGAVFYQYPFNVPAYYALILRSLTVLEGLALNADPNFKVLAASYPYFAKRLLTDSNPYLSDALIELLFKDGRFRWKRLENLLQILILPFCSLYYRYIAPLAIMALPAILNSSNNFELLRKSESEVFDMIESAITIAALRWPEKLLAQKHRIFKPYDMACRSSSTNDDDDGGYNSTGYNQEISKEEEEEPVYNQEITKEDEEEPTKPRRRIIRIKLVKDGKPTTVGSGTGATTATTVGSAATTVGRGMGANLKMASDVPWSNSEEYEKKLENSKRKLKEGYSKFEDSRKRSKRWDDALRAYTVKASQASSLHLVLEATLGLVCGFIMFVRVQTREAALLVGILPQVVALLGHQKEAVRKKAIMALHRFYQKSPSSVFHLVSNFRKRLCDDDPGVMGATLCPLFDLISRDVNSFKGLVVSFIRLLKILSLLGSGDKHASEQKYTVVGDILRKCDSSSNIGNAVLYECVCCVSSMHPSPKLLESAADVIARFLKSDSHNLKYLGIDALCRLIKLSPEIAEQHQLAVIDCLETMNRVFEHAGDLVNIKVAHNLMRLIAEGFGEDDDTADTHLRSSAGYAMTALMKIYAFEMAAGRKVDVLPECETLIEELSASHSSDLQQRAYELQAVLALEVPMLLRTSCHQTRAAERLRYTAFRICFIIDKSLPFLNDFVDRAIEKGSQPYIPESERSGFADVSYLKNQDLPEVHSHGLRFEAYEFPKPSVPLTSPPLSIGSSNELIPVPEPSFNLVNQTTTSLSSSDAGPAGIKLRPDGVQKKWGRSTYSSSSAAPQDTVNGVTVPDAAEVASAAAAIPKGRETTYEPKKPQVEISPEKQKLVKSSGQVAKGSDLSDSSAKKKAPVQPPPDLLDLSQTSNASKAPSVDPFKQLEGLLDVANQSNVSGTKAPDFMGLYGDFDTTGQEGGHHHFSSIDDVDNLMSGLSADTSQGAKMSKGPSLTDALQKDALVRQMGVNPSSQNPNLFKDLLG
ncbi:Protein ACTIVITY OF BC1 COMPLEX KINASE 3, chloroplastic [Linum grandiflorum]